MPYIQTERRARRYDPYLNALIEEFQMTGSVGDLTYCLYRLALGWLPTPTLRRYSDYASVLGALTATVQELYRQEVAPYEDRKRRETGGVTGETKTTKHGPPA